MSEEPMPSSFDGDEKLYGGTPLQRIMRKIKKEPLIPLGTALTVAALVGASLSIRRGDKHRTQLMFRYRVAAQALTIVAVFGGGWYFAEDRKRERAHWKRERGEQEEEKKQKWLAELEARDAEDKAIAARMDRRRQRAAERTSTSASFSPSGFLEDASAAGADGGGPGTGTEAVSIKARAAMAKAKDAAKAEAKEGSEAVARLAAKGQGEGNAARADAGAGTLRQGVMGSVWGALGYKGSEDQSAAKQEQLPADGKGREDKTAPKPQDWPKPGS